MKYLFAAIDARQSRLGTKQGHHQPARAKRHADDLKKLIVESSEAVDEKASSHDFVDTLERIVNEIKNTTEHSPAFLQKVKKSEVPDYYDVIKKPMDLATLMKRVRAQTYRSKKAFSDDLDLIWSNCLLYNSHPSHPLRRSAEILRAKSNQLLEFISDPSLPNRNLYASVNSRGGKAGTPAGEDGDDDGDMDVDSEEEQGVKGSKHASGRFGISSVNQKLLNGGDARDATASPDMSRDGTPVPGDRGTPLRKRALGRRSRSPSLVPDQAFEERSAIIRTPQGMQDFAALDDELSRLEASLDLGPIASTSSYLGLPTVTPAHQSHSLLATAITHLHAAQNMPNPSPLAVNVVSNGNLSSSAGTPQATSPAPPSHSPLHPAPSASASAPAPENARLASLLKSLNPPSPSTPAAGGTPLPTSTPEVVTKALPATSTVDPTTKPPDALWWETIVAGPSAPGAGMPRCSFVNHVEGDPDVEPSSNAGREGKGKSAAKGKGKANGRVGGKKGAVKGSMAAVPVKGSRAKARGKGKGLIKTLTNGVREDFAATKGLSGRMRRNFDTLKEIRRLHTKLSNHTKGPDCIVCHCLLRQEPLEVMPLSDSETDEDGPTASTSFLHTGIPAAAFATSSAAQASRDSLGIVSNRILSHTGFDATSAAAVGVLSHVVGEYITNLGRTLRFYSDRYGAQMSTEEILLHALGENGVPSPASLKAYVSDDIDRYGAKLTALHTKLKRARDRQLEKEEPPAPDEDELFEADTEMMLLGEFAKQTGEDFFGLADFGLDKELGASRIAIPHRLLRGEKRPANPSEVVGGNSELELKYTPPQPHVPLTPAAIDSQIGLLRSVFQLRFKSEAGLTDDSFHEHIRVRNKVPPSGRMTFKVPKRKGDDAAAPSKPKKKKTMEVPESE
ncbi:hypothetical protein T439DRAFT_22334 [Meredithblackwellia eburnea MCA 4105]